MVYLYIIKSIKSKKIYVGISSNYLERIDLHNRGKVRSTKTNLPWELVYLEEYATYAEARKREKYFKNNSGKEWLKRRGII